MKKQMIRVMTATAVMALTAVQPITAFAANCAGGNGTYKVVIGGMQGIQTVDLSKLGNFDCNNLDLESILQQIKDCGVQIPDLPQIPTPPTPGTGETPDLPGDNEGGDNSDNQGGSEDAWTKQVVDLVNAERAKAGLGALSIHNGAANAAQVRANEIITSFSHTRPNGSSFSTALKEAGVSYTSSGENIAYGQRSPQEVMNQWMNSAGHRANILNPQFTSIGVGHVQRNGVDYWTQLFIR